MLLHLGEGWPTILAMACGGVGHQLTCVGLAGAHAFAGSSLARRGPVHIFKHTVVSDNVLLFLLTKFVQVVSVITRRCAGSTVLMIHKITFRIVATRCVTPSHTILMTL